MSNDGSITLYTKEIDFAEDPEDGTVHVFFTANGMDVRVIQTRQFFLKSRANAERFGRELAERERGQIVQLSERGPMFLKERHD